MRLLVRRGTTDWLLHVLVEEARTQLPAADDQLLLLIHRILFPLAKIGFFRWLVIFGFSNIFLFRVMHILSKVFLLIIFFFKEIFVLQYFHGYILNIDKKLALKARLSGAMLVTLKLVKRYVNHLSYLRVLLRITRLYLCNCMLPQFFQSSFRPCRYQLPSFTWIF